MALGSMVDGLRPLLWAGAGVTLYGAAYLFVHDLYIHRRWARFRWTWGPLERVREAHRIHHLFGGEPYGFLFPVVPSAFVQVTSASCLIIMFSSMSIQTSTCPSTSVALPPVSISA